MEQTIRNKLRSVVTQCRKLLEDAVAQALQGQFGIYSSNKGEVHVEDETRMTHLSEEDQAYRKDILDHFDHIKARGSKPKEVLEQLIREVAFTHLNRLCAYKLMEARQVWIGGQRFREAVSRGQKSRGFMFYLADHAEDEARFQTGQQDVAYRHFLDWLGSMLSAEIGVLFNPNDPANRLYPSQRVLDAVLVLINGEELAEIWTEDETLGWVYQYFTPKELREQARKESSVPRNSYELAFRNQFFTPRYVVEFLTDNTLGRIWYEMRKGNTRLKDQCQYMVRRSNEIFLAEGTSVPQDAEESATDLAQEEVLKHSVYIPHRPKKDPRCLTLLDPACGSGHFLLYGFDVLQTIYEEAYNDSDLGPALKQDYPTLDDLRRAVPSLILSRNLHGIDIDLRATQIAALTLWLRVQRAYQEIGLQKDRPKITRSNIVCAEPMPGEKDMLNEFIATLEPKVLGQLVSVVFDKMTLAGEAGSLLKMEEELRDAIAEAKKQWLRAPKQDQLLLFDMGEKKPEQQLLFDLSGITDEKFWEDAEAKVLASLQDYANKAVDGRGLQRRLFADDSAHGFAFIDICQKRFDVVLMNPPFGDCPPTVKKTIKESFPRTHNNLYTAFYERGMSLSPRGIIGLISSRTFLLYRDFCEFRESFLLESGCRIIALADLGWGVLDDAQVETVAFVTSLGHHKQHHGPFFRLLEEPLNNKHLKLLECVAFKHLDRTYFRPTSHFKIIEWSPLCYWSRERLLRQFASAKTLQPHYAYVGQGASPHAFFFRTVWEVSRAEIGTRWIRLCRGGDYSPYFRDNVLVIDWDDNGRAVKEYVLAKYPYLNGNYGWKIQDEDCYLRPGLTFGKRNERFNVQLMLPGHIFSDEGPGIVLEDMSHCWFLLGYLNSGLIQYFLSLTSGLQKHYTYTRPIPILEIQSKQQEHIASLAKTIYEIKLRWNIGAEESNVFTVPWQLSQKPQSISNWFVEIENNHNNDSNCVNECREEVSQLCLSVVNASEDEIEVIKKEFWALPNDLAFPAWRTMSPETTRVDVTARLFSYGVGCVLGRWDIRCATVGYNDQNTTEKIDSLPLCPQGMLQGADGLPLTETPEDYPLRINWDGILVDDHDHPNDIIHRSSEVLEAVWKDQAESIEQEACEILGVKDLRDYFRKPGSGGFWDDHVKRYSKSRRKAPIYWLLQSSKKNYALWIYYHRLDKDMLFKALLNYIEPKIRLEESRLEPLRVQRAGTGASGKGVKKLEKDIERQEEFISELRDFEDKLRRVANLHLEPDLNDGVVLNIAPLWELVPWKEAKNYWEELLGGKYEWSSIGKQLREKSLVHGH